LPSADAVFEAAEMILKVKEPQPQEYDRFRDGQILFTYLHLAADKALTEFLVERKVASVAYETVELEDGRLPLLAPMSEIAGRLVPQIGAHYLQHPAGGRGILLGGATGVRPGRVVILGCGIVGSGAARVASGMGAEVVVIDHNLERLRRLEESRLSNVTTLAASEMGIREAALGADLLIGAVLVLGSKTPALVDRATVQEMRSGSVVVDVDVDQGGCVETSRPTTLKEPTFVEAGVTHYCVKNVPAAVPVTATRALSNALLPFVREVSGRGLSDALNSAPALRRGVVVAEGRVVDVALARTSGREHYPLSSVLPLHSEVR
jgi:alanine dehydrogenase